MGASLPTSGSAKRQLEPEINVTPLVDVVLVLLIIFMVMAPAIAEGEQIELPTILQPDKPKDIDYLDVTLAPNGSVIVEEDRVPYAALKERLVPYYQANPKRKVLLKTDVNLPYKKVRETLALLQGIGFRGLSLKVNKLDQGED